MVLDGGKDKEYSHKISYCTNILTINSILLRSPIDHNASHFIFSAIWSIPKFEIFLTLIQEEEIKKILVFMSTTTRKNWMTVFFIIFNLQGNFSHNFTSLITLSLFMGYSDFKDVYNFNPIQIGPFRGSQKLGGALMLISYRYQKL